jgi:hypothetical protein
MTIGLSAGMAGLDRGTAVVTSVRAGYPGIVLRIVDGLGGTLLTGRSRGGSISGSPSTSTRRLRPPARCRRRDPLQEVVAGLVARGAWRAEPMIPPAARCLPRHPKIAAMGFRPGHGDTGLAAQGSGGHPPPPVPDRPVPPCPPASSSSSIAPRRRRAFWARAFSRAAPR